MSLGWSGLGSLRLSQSVAGPGPAGWELWVLAGQLLPAPLGTLPLVSLVPRCGLVGLPHSMAIQSSRGECPRRTMQKLHCILRPSSEARARLLQVCGFYPDSRRGNAGSVVSLWEQHPRCAIRMYALKAIAVVLAGKRNLSQIVKAEFECCHCVT